MSFGSVVRAKRQALEIGLVDFAERVGVSAAYWSRIERDQERPPRDELIEKAAAILGVRMDDLFIEAERLPPDMRKDMVGVVQAYRRQKAVRRG
jgi:HTH-type transcriptional regulator, competence development regulator